MKTLAEVASTLARANYETTPNDTPTGAWLEILRDYTADVRRAALTEARDATCTFCSHGDEPTMGLHYPKFGDGILQIACNASAIRALLEAP